MKNNNAIKIAKLFIMFFFTVLFLYPVMWLLVNSFKTNQELFTSPWSFPGNINFSNYERAIVVGNVGKFFLNSVFVAVITVSLTILSSAMAAYGVSRLRWKFSKFVYALLISGIMIPQHSTVVPLFYIFQKLGLYNTYSAVIIPHLIFAIPMAVFILTGYFSAIPKELEEAALIDGYSLGRTFFQVIMPVTLPSLVTVAVVTFIPVWNDLLFPQIFLSEQRKMTLPVGLTTFMGRYSTDYVGLIAAVVITIIPTIVAYIILHDRIIDGMTAGAVKG